MKILLLILIIIFIFLILNLFLTKTPLKMGEGFQTSEILPATLENYKQFISFYNPFLKNWENAIISSIVADIPQEPLTSPTQTQTQTTQTAPRPTREQMNAYISQLSITLGQELPQITDSLPSNIDSATLAKINKQIPSSQTAYKNALQWMNDQMEKSQANLGSALQGAPIEAFNDMQNSCQDLSQCIKDNPDLVSQVAQQICNKQTDKTNQKNEENTINNKLKKFNTDTQLQKSAADNIQLIQKSKDIQNKAQSGELYKEINIPGADKETKYTIPKGGNALGELEKNDPQKYNDIKDNYKQWFSLKQLIEQINGNL